MFQITELSSRYLHVRHYLASVLQCICECVKVNSQFCSGQRLPSWETPCFICFNLSWGDNLRMNCALLGSKFTFLLLNLEDSFILTASTWNLQYLLNIRLFPLKDYLKVLRATCCHRSFPCVMVILPLIWLQTKPYGRHHCAFRPLSAALSYHCFLALLVWT